MFEHIQIAALAQAHFTKIYGNILDQNWNPFLLNDLVFNFVGVARFEHLSL